MSTPKRGNHMWTKEEIKKVLALWDTKTTAEIAEEIGVDSASISYIAYALRKSGFNVSKKRKSNDMIALFSEVKAELGI